MYIYVYIYIAAVLNTRGAARTTTWSLLSAGGVFLCVKWSTGHTHTHTAAKQTTHTNTERSIVYGVALVLSCVWCCSCCVFLCVTCSSPYSYLLRGFVNNLMSDGRSAWRGGVGWGGDGARWGARRWPVSAWWAGAGGQSSDDSHGTL